MQIDIENSNVNILLEIDGKIHLVAMKKEDFKAISVLIKHAIEFVIPTNKTLAELNEFLGYFGFPELDQTE